MAGELFALMMELSKLKSEPWTATRQIRINRLDKRVRAAVRDSKASGITTRTNKAIDEMIKQRARKIEYVDTGVPGYVGTVQRVAGDGRVLIDLYSPTGEHLTACWGADALRSAALSHSITGKITK
jgi:hypothetical protein